MAIKNIFHHHLTSKSLPSRRYYLARVGLHLWELLLWLVVLLFLLGTTIASVYSTQEKASRAVKTALETLSKSTDKALQLWGQEQIFIVQELARDKRVLQATHTLLATKPTKQMLQRSPAQSLLRRLFSNFLKGGILRGFFIVSHTNTNLASSRDANVGTNTLLSTQPDFLKHVRQGQTLFSHVIRSDVPLPRQQAIFPGTQHLTQFVGTPIRDEKNKTIALLLLRLDPNKTLYPLLFQARLGQTGRTYILDQNGFLLSPNHHKHNAQPQSSFHPDSPKVFKIRTYVRGLPFKPTEHGERESGIKSNVCGYSNGNGKRIVGAWKWLPLFRAWLLVEQDWKESFALFNQIQKNSYVFAALLAFLLSGLLFAFGFGRKKFREGQIRLAAVVENAQDPIILLDAQGTIKSVNPSTEKMFGYNQQELLDKNIEFLLPYEQHTFPGQLEQDSRSGTSRELKARRKTGKTLLVASTVGQAKLDTGMHFSLILRDITQSKELEHSLKEAKEAAETANRLKSAFLATMSHEIRTPLNGIIATVDMLNHTPLESAQHKLVSTARHSSLALMSIIDDVLDFSKIEAGQMDLCEEDVVVETLVENCVGSLESYAKEKDVELFMFIDPKLSNVRGDKVRLGQILYNLVGNAIKFSANLKDRKGKVMVSAFETDRTGENTTLVLEVRDNGIGMDASIQEKLFKPFLQADSTTTRRFGGSGLGLAITRRLTDLMNGTIALESQPGFGSTFRVSLPLALLVKEQSARKTEFQGVQLFFLKGGNEVDRILEQYIRHAGIELTSANTEQVSERFSDFASTNEDLLVVFDSQGNEQHTKQTIERFRSLAKKKKVRFLIIGRGSENSPCQYGENDVTLAINSMPRSHLLDAIAILAGMTSFSPEDKQARSATLATFTTAELKASGKIALVADDNKVNQDVIRRQLQMLGWAVDVAEDGQEALERWRNNTYKIIFTDCHMPVVDGYELAETIRAEEEEGHHIPIIAITADAIKGTAEKCLASGMDGYLTKPMQLQTLRKTLENWGSVYKQSEDTLPTNQATTDPPIDLEVLPALLDPDEPEVIIQIYNKFLSMSAKLLDQCKNVKLPDEQQKLRDLAHKLKSSAKTIGAHPLADCCQQIEDDVDGKSLSSKARQLYSLLTTTREWLIHHLTENE
ncbi:MAG: hypothetical protein CL920_18205 [Deltaproteobacteria bacterium]|nr:hypothetical protein [Deltaproteobacteria bacterium]